MSWVLISIVAIIAWALVELSKQKGAGGGDLRRALDELARRLEAAEAERARLTQRVENLEAIVTSEPLELEREARRALLRLGQELPGGGGAPPLALEEGIEDLSGEARAARLARRVRGG
jgi:uncharacterized protein YlxW (UPF0749 family)